MEILAAALAFAITMLVLAMVVSAFVELIHRIFSMREAGLKYMLEQMFEQVLKKPIEKFQSQVPALAQRSIDEISKSFVERMSSNRAPMGVAPKATPTRDASTPGMIRLWNGRDLASMTPSEFMERLGSTDFGAAIKKANDSVGAATADAVDAVLKDIAQKFEAVGKEAGDYFEGRARLLSVGIAVVLAFAIHVDAIELFNTYLKNPTVRDAVNGKLETVTAQYKDTQEAVEKAQKAAAAAQTAPADQKPDDPQKQLQGLLDSTKKTVSDLSDIGVPIGWNEERRAAAKMKPIVYTCPEATNPFNLGGNCEKPDIWIQIPTVLSVYLYLAIGGLLIGLGGPFWYSAITSLTSIRNVAGGVQGTAPSASSATDGATSGGPKPSKEAQPTTPVDIFKVAHNARAVDNLKPDTPASSASEAGTAGSGSSAPNPGTQG